MTIEEIYYRKDFSIRSFNICNDTGLKNLALIMSYYRENGTFENLKNCGRKSNH